MGQNADERDARRGMSRRTSVGWQHFAFRRLAFFGADGLDEFFAGEDEGLVKRCVVGGKAEVAASERATERRRIARYASE